MAQLGKAYYCDGCGVEIVSGDYCSGCDPEEGSDEISYLFLGNWTGDQPDGVAQSMGPATGEWWQFWKR